MGQSRSRAETVIGRFLDRAEERGPQSVWYYQKSGRWQPMSWSSARAQVSRLAAGLAALGVEHGTRIGVVGANCPEWVISDYAIQHLGGVTVPLYPNSPVDQMASILQQTGTRICLVGNDELVEKLQDLEVPLTHLITWHRPDEGPVLGWESVMALGEAWEQQHPGGLEDRLAEVRAESPATVIFTSGTGGNPKGAVLTHQNLVWTAAAATQVVGTRSREVTLSYLPLAHAFERVVTTVIPLVAPGQRWTCWFVDDITRLPGALRGVRPTIFVAVPLVWERIQSRVEREIRNARRPQRWIAQLGLRAGQMAATPMAPGVGKVGAATSKLVGGRTLKKLGLGRCWYAVSGAAPLAPDTQRFFQSLGLSLHQGWGLTETTALCTVQSPEQLDPGLVGRPLPGVEIKIGPDEEVLARGPNVFVGYEGLPDGDRPPFDQEGYFRTGDIGVVEEDGQLRIVDRIKDVIITSGGRKVSPRLLEEQLRSDPLVAGAVVLGEGRPYLVALIALDGPEAAKVAGSREDDTRLWEDPQVLELVGQVVERVNRGLAVPEQIHRYAVVPFGFPDEALTPTLKLKRRVVEAAFASTIEGLYA